MIPASPLHLPVGTGGGPACSPERRATPAPARPVRSSLRSGTPVAARRPSGGPSGPGDPGTSGEGTGRADQKEPSCASTSRGPCTCCTSWSRSATPPIRTPWPSTTLGAGGRRPDLGPDRRRRRRDRPGRPGQGYRLCGGGHLARRPVAGAAAQEPQVRAALLPHLPPSQAPPAVSRPAPPREDGPPPLRPPIPPVLLATGLPARVRWRHHAVGGQRTQRRHTEERHVVLECYCAVVHTRPSAGPATSPAGDGPGPPLHPVSGGGWCGRSTPAAPAPPAAPAAGPPTPAPDHPASPHLQPPPPPGGVAWRVSCAIRAGATQGRGSAAALRAGSRGPLHPATCPPIVQAGRVPPRTVRRQGRCGTRFAAFLASLRERLRRPLTPTGPGWRGASGSPGWG